MPDYADVDKSGKEDDPEHEESDRKDVVDEDDREALEEGYCKAFPDFGDDLHDFDEGCRLGGEDAGDGVDDGGGGEEREDEEEGEVGGLEEPEEGPFGGDGMAKLGVVAGVDVGVEEVVFVGDDFEEEELGDLEVSEEDEGERED